MADPAPGCTSSRGWPSRRVRTSWSPQCKPFPAVSTSDISLHLFARVDRARNSRDGAEKCGRVARRAHGTGRDVLLRQQDYCVSDGPLDVAWVGGTVHEFFAYGQRRRTATVEVDGFLSAQGLHDERALLEARPHAVAWLSAVYGHKEQVPLRRDAGERARVAPDAEGVVKLGFLWQDEALGVGVYVWGAVGEEARPAVDDAGPRGERRAVGGDARSNVHRPPRSGVGNEPVGGLAGAGEHGAVFRYGAAAALAQLHDAARGVEYSLHAWAWLRVGAEVWGEQDQLARVGAGEVMLGLFRRAVPAVTAAAADETRLAVEAVDLARRAV